MFKKVYVLVPVTLEESLDKNAGLTFLKEHPVTLTVSYQNWR